jgi:hypothetical protein
MGILTSIIDFVFPIQRRLYHPTGRFVGNSNQFRSPNMQRRFERNRLWRPRTGLNLRRQPQVFNTLSRRITPIRALPLRATTPPTITPPVQKKGFLAEMFSPNINPPLARPQPKRKGFGSTAFKFARLSAMFRK